jgi:hypothetical protein
MPTMPHRDMSCSQHVPAAMHNRAFAALNLSSASQSTVSAGAMERREVRIANDGIAYNRAGFQKHYGIHWKRKWENARKPHNQTTAPRNAGDEGHTNGCASQPTVEDPDDYTDFYNAKAGQATPSQSGPSQAKSPPPDVRNLDSDSDSTTRTWAASATRIDWPRTYATLQSAIDTGHQNGCASQPTVNTVPVQPPLPAYPPSGLAADAGRQDAWMRSAGPSAEVARVAEQLIIDRHHREAVALQDPVRARGSVAPHVSGALQPASSEVARVAEQPDTVQLSFAQLESRTTVSGAGGKMACRKQRELRETLMQKSVQERVYEHNLTHDQWPWRDVLRALPREMRLLLTGPGITKFSFRLLRGQLDPNYRNQDSGERHVFEIQHADGARYHLHFHKNGSMDDPTLVSSAGDVGGATQPARGATQPAHGELWCHQLYTATYNVASYPPVATADMFTPNPPSPPIGRKEAVLACSTMLRNCAGMDICAIDITDEVAFDWRRWIINIAEARQTLAVNVVKVFIIRWERDGPPCITMCREDSTYVCIWPQTHQYGDAVTEMKVHADWPSLHILRNPWWITTDWLSARADWKS